MILKKQRNRLWHTSRYTKVRNITVPLGKHTAKFKAKIQAIEECVRENLINNYKKKHLKQQSILKGFNNSNIIKS